MVALPQPDPVRQVHCLRAVTERPEVKLRRRGVPKLHGREAEVTADLPTLANLCDDGPEGTLVYRSHTA